MLKEEIIDVTTVVNLTGGEPTLLKYFDKILYLIYGKMRRIIVATNAVKFSQSILDGLACDRLYTMTSIDAGTPEIYAHMHGVDCFDRIMNNLARYASARPENVAVKYILSRANSQWSEVRKFLDIAKKLEVSAIIDRDGYLPLERAAVDDLIDMAMLYAKKNTIKIFLGNSFPVSYLVDRKLQLDILYTKNLPEGIYEQSNQQMDIYSKLTMQEKNFD
jgi:molybdenum cofactor biosynthesis enzyme MoaA